MLDEESCCEKIVFFIIYLCIRANGVLVSCPLCLYCIAGGTGDCNL